MNINENLVKKINEFENESIRYLAIQLLKEVEKDTKSITQIENMLLHEIQELIREEE